MSAPSSEFSDLPRFREQQRRLGIVGGSCGVNQAIQAARRHPTGSDIGIAIRRYGRGRRDLYQEELGEVLIFGVPPVKRDTAAAESNQEARWRFFEQHRSSKLQMFKDAGHAAFMFEKEADLQADIVIWFRSGPCRWRLRSAAYY